MADDPQVLSKRLSDFVRQKGTAKELSALIGCDERTAENIRRAHWPIARHWLGLWLAFGDDLIEAVFHPERAAQRLGREIADLERQIEERKAALRSAENEARSFAPRRPKIAARNENRPAAVARSSGGAS